MNTRPSQDREVILSVKDLTVGFGEKIVLDKLNLDIYRGEILGFVGASGAGKSVLMRTVLRLLPRRSGKIVNITVSPGLAGMLLKRRTARPRAEVSISCTPVMPCNCRS